MKLPALPGFQSEAFSKYLKNTGWLMIPRVGSLGIKIIINILVANYLGNELFGKLNYPLAFASFFIAAAALGLDGYVTRELLREPQSRHRIMGSAFRLRI